MSQELYGTPLNLFACMFWGLT